jgi:hypothetical protein
MTNTSPSPTSFDLNLSAQVVELIMSALQELPHKVSRGAIDSIAGQVRPQLEAAQASKLPAQEDPTSPTENTDD